MGPIARDHTSGSKDWQLGRKGFSVPRNQAPRGDFLLGLKGSSAQFRPFPSASFSRWAPNGKVGSGKSPSKHEVPGTLSYSPGIDLDSQIGKLPVISMNEHPGKDSLPVYDRALLLHGSKRDEVLSLAEIEQYGLDSFSDRDYTSIYGMPPREWYQRGIRLLGRTTVECTRDVLGNRIGLDVGSLAARMSSKELVVIDPFAGSCNTLFWILRHLPNAMGIAFESDPLVFELAQRNLMAVDQKIELIHGDYATLIKACNVREDRGIVAFVAPPWGAALDEMQGLDLRCTTPPITEVIQQLTRRFLKQEMVFAIQVYETVSASSLSAIQTWFDWTDFRIYDLNEKGQNHGILLGTKGWVPG